MLHNDLREQAWASFQLDRRRPKQVNLRRACSSAYYAAFHLVLSDIVRLLPGGGARRAEHLAVARSVQHGDIRSAALAFPPWWVANGNEPVDARLQNTSY